MSTYVAAYFVCWVLRQSPGEDGEQFHMHFYNWGKDDKIYLNELSQSFRFYEFGYQRSVYSVREIASYTSMFGGSAWPFIRASFNKPGYNTKSGLTTFDVGFIFEKPSDAVAFKLSCPFELSNTEIPIENIVA